MLDQCVSRRRILPLDDASDGEVGIVRLGMRLHSVCVDPCAWPLTSRFETGANQCRVVMTPAISAPPAVGGPLR